MSQTDRAAKRAARKAYAKEHPWRTLNKYYLRACAVIALIVAVLVSITADVLVSLTDYHGFWRIVLTVLLGVFYFAATFCFSWLGLWFLTGFGLACYLVYTTITSRGQPRKKAAATSAATEPEEGQA